MEALISAIIGDLISRAVPFLSNKYADKTIIAEKLERLKQLLLRIHAIVEEADGRYITNRKMQMQLKLLVESMYRGYHMLDMFRYKSIADQSSYNQSTCFIPFKRSRTIAAGSATGNIDMTADDLQIALENLEAAIANMKEFVVLLGSCERMCRRPYDSYLYTDNFMFSRHVEKQQIISLLLQTPPHPRSPPMVIPIIGGCRVGKKSLVSHVCNDERIQSHFSSILYMSGDSICRIERANFSNGRTLVVLNFATDVVDDDWAKFYSVVAEIAAGGSKLIIVSRIENISRLGTVKVVTLNNLSHQEYSYLFKMLAFGSTNEEDYPQLASIAKELAVVLGGSLITANAIADMLRRSLDVQSWLRILRTYKSMVDTNLSKYGEHPKNIIETDRPIDICKFGSSRLRLMPPQVERDDYPKRETPTISLGNLLTGIAVPNEDEFMLVTCGSRIPPYTKYVCHAVRVKENHGCASSIKKRRSIA